MELKGQWKNQRIMRATRTTERGKRKIYFLLNFIYFIKQRCRLFSAYMKIGVTNERLNQHLRRMYVYWKRKTKGSPHVELCEFNNMQIFYVVFIFLNYS